MKMSDKVRIGGVTYTIEYEERLNCGDKILLGQLDYDNSLIKLEPKLQGEQGKMQTLWHEILHGIAIHFGLAVNEDEETIDKLAKGVYMVITDNPEMFRD